MAVHPSLRSIVVAVQSITIEASIGASVLSTALNLVIPDTVILLPISWALAISTLWTGRGENWGLIWSSISINM